jgi:hypothetical protein
MAPKFLLKEDMVIKLDVAGAKKEIRLFDKGKIFEPNKDGLYDIVSVVGKSTLDENGMRIATDPNTGNILFDVLIEPKETFIQTIQRKIKGIRRGKK